MRTGGHRSRKTAFSRSPQGIGKKLHAKPGFDGENSLEMIGMPSTPPSCGSRENCLHFHGSTEKLAGKSFRNCRGAPVWPLACNFFPFL